MYDMENKAFDELLVGDVFRSMVVKPSVLGVDATIKEVINEMLENPIARKVYIVDGEGKLMGTVTTETVLRLIGYRVGVRETGVLPFIRFLRDVLKEKAADVMTESICVRHTTPLEEAFSKMLEHHLNDLPVVDDEGMLIGELNTLQLFSMARSLFE